MSNDNAPLIDLISKKIRSMHDNEFMIVNEPPEKFYIRGYDPEYDDEELLPDSGGFWIENRYIHVPPDLLELTQTQFDLLLRKAR